MADPRVERLADVVVSYSTAVRPGDLVLVDASPAAAPLVRETYRRILAAGGHPQVHSTLEGALEVLLREGSDDQLEWISPARAEEVERARHLVGGAADVGQLRLEAAHDIDLAGEVLE